MSDLLAAAVAGGGDGTILSPDRVGVPRMYTENDVVMGILSGVTFDVHEDQRLAGGGVQTVVRTFRIDPEDCTGGIR